MAEGLDQIVEGQDGQDIGLAAGYGAAIVLAPRELREIAVIGRTQD
jgi:hypothetical protein